MNKNERLLTTLNLIDEKYIEEAEIKMKRSTSRVAHAGFIGAIACFILLIGIGMYLFIPFKDPVLDLSAYAGSEYFPIIEKIADYRYKPNAYKNNFAKIKSSFTKFGAGEDNGMPDNMAPAPENGAGSNSGSYVEVTDNQVSGVIEADIIKRTDKYIFRIGMHDGYETLMIYSISGEDSILVNTYKIPKFDQEAWTYLANIEMYLSEDANTVTIIKGYSDSTMSKIGIISLDVSNVTDIRERDKIAIDGSYNSSRIKDGKLLLVTEFFVRIGDIDYTNPKTFVPTITRGDEEKCIEFEDIIYPDKLSNLRYSIVTLFDEGTLELLGANALLSFGNTVYVSENNIYVTNTHNKTEEHEDGNVRTTMTDIAIINYSDGKLTKNGIITVDGSIKDQWSLDEYEGHLRVVTSTFTRREYKTDEEFIRLEIKRNVNLYAISLESQRVVGAVIAFAPDNEEASSVRFDGNTAYVCTAEVVTFTDPVYFFDLSDYENITYTDTGTIDGFSSSLINLGDGFLLGIGQLNASTLKIEVYEQGPDGVVSVDAITLHASYSTDYKSYLVDRENRLFGFGFYSLLDQDNYRKNEDYYVLIHFDGYKLRVVSATKLDESPDRMRGIYVDNYLYITTDKAFKAIKVF